MSVAPLPAPTGWRRRDRLWGYFFVAPQTIGMLVFVLIPFVMTMVLSFEKWSGLGPMKWVGLDNYANQLTDPLFQRAVLNTCLIALITVPIGLALALLFARLLQHVRGRSVYLIALFAPVVTNSIAVAMIWQQLLRQDSPFSAAVGALLHTEPPNWLGEPTLALLSVCLVAIWSSLGLNVVIMLSGLQTIPPTILEAARVDGAGPIRRFFSIEVPLVSPIIFYSVVVAVISSFQTFDIVYVLTNNAGPDNATRTIVYHIYDVGYRSAKMGVSSAASVVLLILTLAVTLLQFAGQKKLVNYDL